MPLDPQWQQEWPQLTDRDFAETSPATDSHNCFAWSVGNTDRWWWPSDFSYWPRGAPREVTLDAFAQAYASLGFEPCSDNNFEQGFEKVAIYADEFGRPKHAALQLPDGYWTSKLGSDVDITHHNLTCLEGGLYGRVALVLRRRLPGPSKQSNKSEPTLS
jgi:hypothetical protein